MIPSLAGTTTLDASAGLNAITTPQYVVQVTVSDGLLTNAATLTVNVVNINDPPDIDNLPDVASISEDTPSATTVFTLSVSDRDLDTAFTCSVASGGPFTVAAGKILNNIAL